MRIVLMHNNHACGTGCVQVCDKGTGHAEVVAVTFDPTVVTFRDLLDVFFTIHDPTTPNRQGADVGPQYRSIILYTSDEQKRVAEEVGWCTITLLPNRLLVCRGRYASQQQPAATNMQMGKLRIAQQQAAARVGDREKAACCWVDGIDVYYLLTAPGCACQLWSCVPRLWLHGRFLGGAAAAASIL